MVSRKVALNSLTDSILSKKELQAIDREFVLHELKAFLTRDASARKYLDSEKFNPHFHIPLQSGSDKILKDMKRRYNTNLYYDRVSYIREKSKYACIGSDVIVGFPTESDFLFNETKEFIESLDINYLHVFPYSDREKASASLIENKPKISSLVD